MSWGIEYPGYMSRVTKTELPDIIETETHCIEIIRNTMLVYVARGGNMNVEELVHTFNEMFRDLEDSFVRRYQAEVIMSLEDDEVKEV